jgi:hypothetical protein
MDYLKEFNINLGLVKREVNEITLAFNRAEKEKDPHHPVLLLDDEKDIS